MTEESENDDISLLSLDSLLEEERRSYAPFDPFKRDAIKLKMRELSKDELINIKNTTSPDNDMYFVIEHELLLKSKIEFCEQKYKKDQKILSKISLIQGIPLIASIVLGFIVFSNVTFPLLSIEMFGVFWLLIISMFLASLVTKHFVVKHYKQDIEQIDFKHRDDLFEISEVFLKKSRADTFRDCFS